MQDILKIIGNQQPYIIIGLLFINLIFLILIITLFKSLGKLEQKYRRFMRGSKDKNIEELITVYLDKVDEGRSIAEEVKTMYDSMELRLKDCIQKVAVIRYKAFENVGSDLSFSIALLNYSNDGVIITGIYGRNESTTYAKPIDKGISRYDLSEEELKALNQAIEEK